MKKTSILFAFALSLSGNAFGLYQTVTYNLSFPFSPTQDALLSDQYKMVDSIYAALAPGQTIKINVLSAEEEKYNTIQRAQLSYKRTHSFLVYCAQNRIPQEEYYALVTPFTLPNSIKTKDLTHNFYNSFIYNKSQSHFVFTRPQLKATAKSAVQFDASTEKEAQQFVLSADKPMDVKLKSGTAVNIPANSLMFANGSEPKGAVNLTVSEYKDMDAIVFKAMTTTCGGKKLQTAGMWYIHASADGKPLHMKPGHKYDIVVAMTGEQKNMKVFTGNMKNGMLDWVEQKDDKVVFTTNGMDSENTEIKNIKNVDINNNLNNNLNDIRWNDNRNLNQGFGVFQREQQQRDSVKSYDLKLNDFGWINCDAFDQTQQLTDVFVSGDIPKDATVMMVYTKRKSVLPGYVCDDGKSVKFSNVAENEQAILIVYKRNADGKTVTKFTKVVNPQNEKMVRSKTDEVSLEALQTELKTYLADV